MADVPNAMGACGAGGWRQVFEGDPGRGLGIVFCERERVVDKPFLGGIVVAVAVLVGAGAFVMAPRMQGPEDKVLARTSMHTERARRLLHQFSENQERIGALLEALTVSGVGADIDVEKLLEEEENRTSVEEEDARLHEITRQGAGELRALEERFLQAAHGEQWQQFQQPVRRRLGSNVAQMTRSLSEGLRERERLVSENRRLLEQALEAVNEALAQTFGDAAGRENVHANRLKAVILYYRAQTRNHEAGFLRQEVARLRAELANLGRQAGGLLREKNLVAASGIDDQIAASERDVAEAQTLLAEITALADTVQADVDEIKSRMADARATANQTRAEMERMEAHGVDLTAPDGFERFAAEFNQLARTYRQAMSELNALESGTLRNARIDSSGDYINGRYVPADDDKPIHIDRGLAGLECDLSGIRLKAVAAGQSVESARALRDSLLTREAEYHDRATRAAARLETLADAASKTHEEFARVYGEVQEAEGLAIDDYSKSARAFTDAARYMATRSGEASAAVAGLSPEALERSPDNAVADDAWLEQQYKVNAADARIDLGRLYYTISEEARRTADVLAALPEAIAPPSVDPADWREKQEETRTKGIDVLHAAYDALQRTRGRLRGHWAFAAEAAAAANLLAMLGEEELRDVAIATYEAVVSGQEDQPHMQAYVNRLSMLRKQ